MAACKVRASSEHLSDPSLEALDMAHAVFCTCPAICITLRPTNPSKHPWTAFSMS